MKLRAHCSVVSCIEYSSIVEICPGVGLLIEL